MSIILEALDVDTVRTLITALAGALFGVVTTVATGLVSIARDAIARRYERWREVQQEGRAIVRRALGEAQRHRDGIYAASVAGAPYVSGPAGFKPMLDEASMIPSQKVRTALGHAATIVMTADMLPLSPARILDVQRIAIARAIGVTSAYLRRQRIPKADCAGLQKEHDAIMERLKLTP